MSQRQILSSDGVPIQVWEESDPENPGYESKSALNPDGWLIFLTEHGRRRLRLYPRDWLRLPEYRLRELYRRARPA
jgi:hypothetical protein